MPLKVTKVVDLSEAEVLTAIVKYIQSYGYAVNPTGITITMVDGQRGENKVAASAVVTGEAK